MSSEMDISGNGPSLVPGGDASATDIKTELDRILASPIFSGARRPSEFLRYVVETALKGDGAGIKEYLIGIDVFGRTSQYDPRVDPVVRIEAGRLRAKLSQYYAGPGKDDPIVVELPKGSYVPEFRRRPQIGGLHGAPTAGAAAIPSDDAAVTAPARRAHKRRVGLLVATAGFLTVVATVLLRYDHLLRKPPLNASDTIVVGDFANATGNAVFDETLKTAVTHSLVQSPFLNILPCRSAGLYALWDRAGIGNGGLFRPSS